MTADLLLYLRSHKADVRHQWWPETLLYASIHSVTFEVFARAKSGAYFDKLKNFLAVRDKAELVQRIEKIESDPALIPKWQFQGISPRELIQLDAIATTP
jgi:hypothetical protein